MIDKKYPIYIQTNFSIDYWAKNMEQANEIIRKALLEGYKIVNVYDNTKTSD